MSILPLLAALLPSATLLMSNPPADSPDYTAVPPDPYEVEQRLSAAPINAQEAVKQAGKTWLQNAGAPQCVHNIKLNVRCF